MFYRELAGRVQVGEQAVPEVVVERLARMAIVAVGEAEEGGAFEVFEAAAVMIVEGELNPVSGARAAIFGTASDEAGGQFFVAENQMQTFAVEMPPIGLVVKFRGVIGNIEQKRGL